MGTCSWWKLRLLRLHPFYSEFTSCFFSLSLAPLLPFCSLSYSPTLCSLTPHFLSTLFISLPTNPSLFILALSPSIWWNSAADNACNWSDSHFSSVFGPDKEYCQHFADMASAGRIKWTLFCSVCSKLKASQFICSCPRLTGPSYSGWNAVERGRHSMREISFFPKKHQPFGFVVLCTRSPFAGEGERERSRPVVLRSGDEHLGE